MTRIPGLDAWLTREGPEHTCDPHAPFSVVSTWVGASVYDDRDEEAPPVITFLTVTAKLDAERWAAMRNAEVERQHPPNEDGSGGSCTVCGDFHGEHSVIDPSS